MPFNHQKKLIIVGANSTLGKAAACFFHDKYDLLLLDFDLKKLKHTQTTCCPRASILKFDITSTIHLVGLVSYLKRRGGYDFILNFLHLPEEENNIDLVYKVNLRGTKNLLNYLYPLAAPGSLIINISAATTTFPAIESDLIALLSDPLNQDFITRISAQTKSVKEAYLNATIGTLILTKRDFSKWELKKTSLYAMIHSLGVINYTPLVTERFLTLIINIFEKETLLTNGAIFSFNNDNQSLSEVVKQS